MNGTLWIKQGDRWERLCDATLDEHDQIHPVPPEPEPTPLERALDILRPHLAWDHRYRP